MKEYEFQLSNKCIHWGEPKMLPYEDHQPICIKVRAATYQQAKEKIERALTGLINERDW